MENERLELEKEFQHLLETHNAGPVDRALMTKAWEFAKLSHGDTLRKSGELYISHPLKAAQLLCDWGLDTTTIIAELLHDTIEDGGATREDLVSEFGEEAANLVDGVTKVSNLRLKGSTDNVFVETFRKMVLVMAKDLRVVFVKLADRTHNMQTLSALPPEKQKRIARETLEIFAPLAERLGMGLVKAQLEDLAFKHLYPEEYTKLIEDSKPFYKEATAHTDKMRTTIEKALEAEKIHSEVNGRQKHLYSLWRKLSRKEIDRDFEKIHDIVALRILVDKVPDCYAALGIVHALYKPVPNLGISDFIAQPKPNGYRSIHTKVFGPGGRIVEVQIRTFQMHAEAENGAAAHWAYADAKSKGVSDKILEGGHVQVDTKLTWVKELVAWQNQLTDSEEFLKAVKFDALSERNFVFSPNGDVYDLPVGSTPVDFAYAVHTNLGSYIQGAKVNGKIVPLNKTLKSGDVVEILKSKNIHEPNRDWLRFVVTTTARRQISKILNK